MFLNAWVMRLAMSLCQSLLAQDIWGALKFQLSPVAGTGAGAGKGMPLFFSENSIFRMIDPGSHASVLLVFSSAVCLEVYFCKRRTNQQRVKIGGGVNPGRLVQDG